MHDQIKKSISSFHFFSSSLIFLIVLIILAFLQWINPIENLLTVDADIHPMYHLFVISSCSFYVLMWGLCFTSLLIYWEESKEKNLPVLSSSVVEYLNFWGGLLLSLFIVSIALYHCKGKLDTFSDVRDILLSVIMLTLFGSCFACAYNLVFAYDDVDLSISQNCDRSIGALWAVGAYDSYYKLTLEDIIEKIQDFEKEHSVHIPVKKLFIICPLSCNVNGSLNKKDDWIFKEGQLKNYECDQGANINRRYKHSVYKIQTNENEYKYVVAEYASPLGTLWEKRLSMNKEKLNFQRDCLISNLKDLLKNYPCAVVEYDDENPAETKPLHRFMLESIQKELVSREKFNDGDKSEFCMI